MRILRSPATWCFLVAVAVRAALFIPDTTPDTWRFFNQAQGFLEGEGFRDCTSLPPGYPLFLALVSLGSDTRFDIWLHTAWVLNILMSLASCFLVYAAVRPKAPRAAVGAFFCMAVSPVLARLTGYLLSETFAVFLASMLAYEVARFEMRGAGPLHVFLIGFLCVALLLTAPATIPLAFFVWCYLAWGNRKKIRNLAALAAASLLLMIPWQIHCYRVTGKPQPIIYTTGLVQDSGFTMWCRTWVSTQGDMGVWWHPEQFRWLPDSLFSSPEEREALTALYYRKGTGRLARDPELSEPFRAAALKRIAESPSRFYLVLPAKRSLSLWFDAEYGWSKAIQQLHRFSFTSDIPSGHSALQATIRSLVGSAGFLAYNGVHLVLVLVAILGLRSRRLMPWLIVSSVVIYTVISAVTAMGEFRRDLPFYPFILLILFYLTRTSRNHTGLNIA